MKSYNRKIYKDMLVRENFVGTEFNRIKLYYFLNNYNVEKDMKSYLYLKWLKNFKLFSSITRIRNFCIYTGRSRWILRRFKMSRIVFRNNVNYGLLMGVRKSSR